MGGSRCDFRVRHIEPEVKEDTPRRGKEEQQTLGDRPETAKVKGQRWNPDKSLSR